MAHHNRQSTVLEAIDQLNNARLTAVAGGSGKPSAVQRKLEALQEARQATAKGFMPSGKRQPGVGCDDEDQGILHAEAVAGGGAKLHITLLAAGFIIGPGGASVREISKVSGADIRSWNDTLARDGNTHQVRCVVVEGKRRAIVLALEIITEALDRYKELCEGKYCGHAVDRLQQVHGVSFYYSPPPRAAVPYAAALKSHTDRSAGPVNVLDVHAEQDKENILPAALRMKMTPAAAQPAQQVILLAPNLVLPMEAVIQALPSSSYAGPHLLPSSPLAASTTAEQASQLLAALRAPSPGMPALAQQGEAWPVAPPALFGQGPFTPPAVPSLATTTTGRRLGGGGLDRAAAGNLDDMLPPGELERIQHAAALPTYSLFGPGPLFRTDLAAPAAATPALPQLNPMPGPPAGPALHINSDPQLLATGFPTFQSFAQQSPYYMPGAADPWLLPTAPQQPGMEQFPSHQLPGFGGSM